MTIEHEEAARLAEQFGAQRTTYRNLVYTSAGLVISEGNFTAMLKKYRSQIIEEILVSTGELKTPPDIKGRFQSELFWRGAYAMRDAIRARLEEGK